MKFYILICLLIVANLCLAQIQVHLEVDSDTISLNEVVGVNVKVIGARNSSTPTINTNENFNIQHEGSSSQISIINGDTTISTSHQYQLSPIKPGTFTLGPATVEVNGKEFTSNTISIKVGGTTNIPNKDRNYYVEAFLDKKEAYLGEQVIYTFKLFNKVQLYNSTLEIPKFDGFISESLGSEKSIIKIINGVRWKETEIKTLLIPTRTGDFEIPPASINAKLIVSQSFFGAETKPVRLISETVKIKIKELPLTNKPANFLGLIGEFDIKASIEKNNIKRGESTTLTLEISGIGDSQDFPEPAIKTNDFKIYNDKPTFNKTIQGDQIKSVKTFKKAIVPQKAGTIMLPAIEITFFNPISGKYESRSTQAISINVLPSENGEDELKMATFNNLTSEKRNINLLATDLMPIFYHPGVLEGNFTKKINISHLYVFNILTFVLYIFLYYQKNMRNKLKLDVKKIRRNKAFGIFNKQFKTLKHQVNFASHASTMLREYLGDKLQLDGKSITTFDLDKIFLHSQISKTTLIELKNIFAKLDNFQFGGITISDQEKDKLLVTLVKIVKKLEKEI